MFPHIVLREVDVPYEKIKVDEHTKLLGDGRWCRIDAMWGTPPSPSRWHPTSHAVARRHHDRSGSRAVDPPPWTKWQPCYRSTPSSGPAFGLPAERRCVPSADSCNATSSVDGAALQVGRAALPSPMRQTWNLVVDPNRRVVRA